MWFKGITRNVELSLNHRNRIVHYMDDRNLVFNKLYVYITYRCVKGVLKWMECIEWCVERWYERAWCVYVHIYLIFFIVIICIV